MTIRVLLVDDQEDFLTMGKRWLSKVDSGFDIDTTTSGKEALDSVLANDYDAVILDFDFGAQELNGVEILREIRRNGNDTPIIIFTGKSREEVAIQALNLGADYYLRKDAIDPRSLYAEMVYHIRRAVKNRETRINLIHSENLFSQFFDNASFGMLILSSDHRIISANKALLNMLGYTLDDVVTKQASEIVLMHETDLEMIQQAIVDEKSIYSVERELVAADSSQIIREITYTLIRDTEENVDCYIAVINTPVVKTASRKATAQ